MNEVNIVGSYQNPHKARIDALAALVMEEVTRIHCKALAPKNAPDSRSRNNDCVGAAPLRPCTV